MPPIDRRTFLRGGGIALLGAAAACGGGAPTAPRATGDTLDGLIGGRAQTLGVVMGLTEVLSRPDERIPVILHDPSDPAKTFRGGAGKLWLAESRTSPVLGPFALSWHDEGLRTAEEGSKGIYSTRISITRNGSWLGLVEATPQGAAKALIGGAQFAVGRRSEQPIPGDEAVSVPTPTKANHRGVEPYCTRKPPCAMHDISLDDALANGKPTVLIIATPAFCTSRTCGPEVDIVQAVRAEQRARVNFVHIEVYKDDRDAPAKAIRAPAAEAWKLEEEPVTYFIAASGDIADRFIGPAAVDEVREATRTLL